MSRDRFLRHSAVLPGTAAAYRSSFHLFKDFCAVRLNVRVSSTMSVDEVDRLLEVYIQSVHDAHGGRCMHLGVRAQLGIYQELGFRFRGGLLNSSRALKGWRKAKPAVSAPPLPRAWAKVFGFVLALNGHLSAGIALLVAWSGYLRISEALSLRVGYVLFPGSGGRRTFHGCGLRIRQAKGGRNQYASIDDPTVVAYLEHICTGLSPQTKLFGSLRRKLVNRLLGWLSRLFELPVRFRSHSCRHGHVSEDQIDHVDPEVTRRAGRWKVASSMDTYRQACAALAVELIAPPLLSVLLLRADFYGRALLCASRLRL